MTRSVRRSTLGVVFALLLAGCFGQTQISVVTPRPEVPEPHATAIAAAATSAPATDPIEQPTPAQEPAATPTEAPVATPAPTPEVTPAPTQAPAQIAFGTHARVVGGDVELRGTNRPLHAGGTLAWRVELAPALGSETILITVANATTGETIHSEESRPEPGVNVFYADTSGFIDEPGDYLLQYVVDGELRAEGAFTVEAPRTEPAPEPTPDNSSDCHPSYPGLCIAPPPPDIDCGDISASDFRVRGSDPHNFDGDHDGIGCESGGENGGGNGGNEPKPTQKPRSEPKPDRNCDPSYPTLCISPNSPDLDCGDVRQEDFPVRGRDPHGFDGDRDGVGCES